MKTVCFLSLLLILEQFTIIGPAHLSYAGNLERVAERRVQAGWGVSDGWQDYQVLVGSVDCAHLGRAGWLVTSGSVLSAVVVDCAQKKHRQAMIDGRLLGDVNRREIVHREGWLILK